MRCCTFWALARLSQKPSADYHCQGEGNRREGDRYGQAREQNLPEGIGYKAKQPLIRTIRGALESIPAGQLEGGRCLGLSWFQTVRSVILPQALRDGKKASIHV